MEATTPTAKSKRRLRRKRRELDALVVGVAANGRPPRRGTRTSSSSDSSSCGGDDPEAGLCPPRASSSSSGGGCRRREEARRRCGRRHSRCTGGRGPKGTGRRCLSSRPRGTLPLAVRGAGACMAVACLLGAATALAWLFLDARHQTDSLRVHLDAVVAGSKGVPDALQKCHSMSKELQHNQTLLLAQLMTLTSQVTNFSLQVKEVHHGLSEVEDRLKGAPELVRVPQELAELSGSVGRLGSSVGGLDASVASLKASSVVLRNESDFLRQEVTNLKEAIMQISNVSAHVGSGNLEGGGTADSNEEDLKKLVAALKKELTELGANVSRLNDTVGKKLNLDNEDLSKHYQRIIDVLVENVSTRVSTLEGSCASIKEQRELSNAVYHISSQANETLSRVETAESQIDLLLKQENVLSRKGSVEEASSAFSTSSTIIPEAHPTNGSLAAISSEEPVSSAIGITQNTTLNHQTQLTTGSNGGDVLKVKSGEENKKSTGA